MYHKKSIAANFHAKKIESTSGLGSKTSKYSWKKEDKINNIAEKEEKNADILTSKTEKGTFLFSIQQKKCLIAILRP
jgi:hypothetical protein